MISYDLNVSRFGFGYRRKDAKHVAALSSVQVTVLKREKPKPVTQRVSLSADGTSEDLCHTKIMPTPLLQSISNQTVTNNVMSHWPMGGKSLITV